MRFVASALERAFPKALFAIALGNNDVPCGDYRSANGSEYLASVARIWAPLVDRDGAAPDFVASFSRGGHYTARLPVRGLRLVVLNTVVLSSQYEGSCDGSDFNNVTNELRWLVGTLRATPPGTRNVVMMHIPPGYDAFSTEYIRGLLAWPFLERRSNAVLVRALADPSDRVAYAIAGHAHRFDFRLAAQVPVVVLGSLSPIYRNSPAFYALHVARDGTLTDVDAYGFDEGTQTWSSAHSFDRRWGVDGINAASLARLHARLANLPAARAVWDRQANGWPTDQMESPGTWAGDWWRVAWCAQDLTLPNFAQCAGIERGTRIVIFGAVVAAVAILLAIIVVRLRVVKRPGRAGRAFE
jgi:hypothetical protein